jgi:hypothetical protein
MHIVHKECVDRGNLTSEKLRRDTIEPSSTGVQVYTERTLCQVQGEEYQRKILTELLNTL